MDIRELSRQVQCGTSWDFNQIERILTKSCGIICEVLSSGKDVQIRGFGSFKPEIQNGRVKVNFYPGKDVKDACKLLKIRLEELEKE